MNTIGNLNMRSVSAYSQASAVNSTTTKAQVEKPKGATQEDKSTAKSTNTADALKLRSAIQESKKEEFVQKDVQKGKVITQTMEKTYAKVGKGVEDLTKLSQQLKTSKTPSQESDIIAKSTKILDSMASDMSKTKIGGTNVFKGNHTVQTGKKFDSQLTIETPKLDISKNTDGSYNIKKNDGTTLSHQSVKDILKNDSIKKELTKNVSENISKVKSYQDTLSKLSDAQSNVGATTQAVSTQSVNAFNQSANGGNFVSNKIQNDSNSVGSLINSYA